MKTLGSLIAKTEWQEFGSWNNFNLEITRNKTGTWQFALNKSFQTLGSAWSSADSVNIIQRLFIQVFCIIHENPSSLKIRWPSRKSDKRILLVICISWALLFPAADSWWSNVACINLWIHETGSERSWPVNADFRSMSCIDDNIAAKSDPSAYVYRIFNPSQYEYRGIKYINHFLMKINIHVLTIQS